MVDSPPLHPLPSTISTTEFPDGLTVWYQDDQSLVDIVFVNGLNGNRLQWLTQASNTRNVFWPRDLLPSDLPRTRIMGYEYPAKSINLGFARPEVPIRTHALDLLERLTIQRKSTNTKGRPIFFVAHSLGGFVTKGALIISNASTNLHSQDIIHSLAGICFVDTPSYFPHFAHQRGVVKNFIESYGYTPRIDDFKDHQKSSTLEELLSILCDFDGILKKLAQETNPIPAIAYFDSSNISIQNDHTNMAKFSRATDLVYIAVSGELRRLIDVNQKPQDTQRNYPASIIGRHEAAPSDSGYGSQAHDNASVYSNYTYDPRSKEENIEGFANALVKRILRENSISEPQYENLLSMLPDTLKAFGQKIAHTGKNNSFDAQTVSFFMQRYREDIFEKIRSQLASCRKASPESNRKVGDWLQGKHTDNLSPDDWLRGEQNEIPGDVFQGVLEDEGRGDEPDDPAATTTNAAIQATFARYYELLVDTPAYDWLIAKLCSGFRLSWSCSDSAQKISTTVRSELSDKEPRFRKYSPTAPPHLCDMKIRLEWDFPQFHKDQGYVENLADVFEGAITLTSDGVGNVQALTTAEYLGQTWPYLGDDIVLLMRALLSAGYDSSSQTTTYDGTQITARSLNSQMEIRALGPLESIAEISELFAWLTAALRTSDIKEQGVVSYVPSIIDLRILTKDTRVATATCHIVAVMKSQKRPDSADGIDGRCWHGLFYNPVIVEGYPVLVRQGQDSDLGLDIPLGMLAQLMRTRRISELGPNLLIKGFSRLLVLTAQVQDIFVWHLLYNKSGEYISYADPRVGRIAMTCPQNTMYNLETSRHVLGWCSNVENLAGTKDAKYNIRGSCLPRPGRELVWDKFTITARKFVQVAIAASIGQKDDNRVTNPSDDYIKSLKWIGGKFVILYDLDESRAWLLDGASTLLHLVRAFLHTGLKDPDWEEMGVEFASIEIEEANRNESRTKTAKAAALKVLTTQNNQDLEIYRGPYESSEEREEVLKVDSKWGDPKTTRKTKLAKYCFVDQVKDIFHILEQIIHYQNKVNSKDGIEIEIKGTTRAQLVGFDFMQIAKNDAPFKAQVATFKTSTPSWIKFARSIDAVSLLGRGFGDLMKPIGSFCPHWGKMPHQLDYLAVCSTDLETIFTTRGDKGEEGRNLWRVSDHIYWTSPSQSLDQCQCSKSKHKCDPVQSFFRTKFPKRWDRWLRSPSSLPHGAVIFGKDSTYSFLRTPFHKRKWAISKGYKIMAAVSSVETKSSLSSGLGLGSKRFSNPSSGLYPVASTEPSSSSQQASETPFTIDNSISDTITTATSQQLSLLDDATRKNDEHLLGISGASNGQHPQQSPGMADSKKATVHAAAETRDLVCEMTSKILDRNNPPSLSAVQQGKQPINQLTDLHVDSRRHF